MEQTPKSSILVVIDDDMPVNPAKHVLTKDVCTIGRSAECDVVVDDNAISRLHAKIEFSGFRYVLIDAGSVNGTFINTHPLLEPHTLQQDDVIGLSKPKPLLRFEDADPTHHLPTTRLRYDQKRETFFLNYRLVELTRFEFRLLYFLYRNAGELCTRDRCAEAVWQEQYSLYTTDPNALNRVISNLRLKLRRIDPKAEMIETHHGRGYLLHL